MGDWDWFPCFEEKIKAMFGSWKIWKKMWKEYKEEK